MLSVQGVLGENPPVVAGGSVMKRFAMSRSKSRKQFRRNAGTHVKNLRGTPMRGGIRL